MGSAGLDYISNTQTAGWCVAYRTITGLPHIRSSCSVVVAATWKKMANSVRAFCLKLLSSFRKSYPVRHRGCASFGLAFLTEIGVPRNVVAMTSDYDASFSV